MGCQPWLTAVFELRQVKTLQSSLHIWGNGWWQNKHLDSSFVFCFLIWSTELRRDFALHRTGADPAPDCSVYLCTSMYVSVKADTERGKKQTLSWAFCLHLFLCSGSYFLNRYPLSYRGFFVLQSCISLDFAPSPWAVITPINMFIQLTMLHTMIPKPSVSGSAHSKSLWLLPSWRAGLPWHEASTPRAASTPHVPTVPWPRRGAVVRRTASGSSWCSPLQLRICIAMETDRSKG